jgi:hypothetical protein
VTTPERVGQPASRARTTRAVTATTATTATTRTATSAAPFPGRRWRSWSRRSSPSLWGCANWVSVPALLIATFLAALAGRRIAVWAAGIAVGLTVLCVLIFVVALQLRLPLVGSLLTG